MNTTEIDGIKLYSHSNLLTWETCARKHYFQYTRRWQPQGSAPALAFGAAWGVALDRVWSLLAHPGTGPDNHEVVANAMHHWSERYTSMGMPHPDSMDVDQIANLQPRTPEVAEAMLYEYIDMRREFLSNIELIGVEDPFIVPIYPNDATRFYVGLLDKVYRDKRDNRIYAMDHKTTTAYATKGFFRSSFTNSFSPNAQMDGYIYALRYKYGRQAKHVMIDACLVHKTVHNGFRFIPVHHNEAQLDAWLWEVRKKVQAIEYEQGQYEAFEIPKVGASYMGAYPRSTHSCHSYNGCPFIDVCTTVANPAQLEHPPAGFIESQGSTAERLGITEDTLARIVEMVRSSNQ